MEELQAIIEMISKLPQTALWVLVGFWTYKVVVIGSIYGVIRFAIEKAHSWATTPKESLIKVRPMLERITITGNLDQLIGQISRICGKGTSIGSTYIHDRSIQWLKEAIDEKEARERAKETA